MSAFLHRVMRFIKVALLLGIAAFTAVQLWFLGHIAWWTQVNPNTTRFMELRLEALRKKDPSARLSHVWIPYERISLNVKRAAVAAEDTRFMQHFGVDWEAIEKARERNEKRGRVTHGGSTITQQLAKNLFLSGERSYVRKGQELLITWMLEAVMSKRRILEIYLNVVELGNGVYGVEAGARHHFGLSANRLEAPEAARLAAMLPAPRYFDRNPESDSLYQRSAVIQQRMLQVAVPR